MGGQGVQRFSTAAAPTGGRLAYWNALASEIYNNMVIDADAGQAFAAEMVRAKLGELSLMSAHSAPAEVSRRSDPQRNARGLGVFDLHFQLTGRSLNAQSGREAVLEAGDFTLCDASRPYQVRFTEANHMLCIKVPMAALAQRLGDVEGLICKPVSGSRGTGAMLSSFLASLWPQIDQAEDGHWGETVSEVILDLMTLAYRPLSEGPAAASGRRQWMAKARGFIDEHICDPELGAAVIARAIGVSPRYVQMLFAAEGTTPSALIQDRRLRLAAERLRRPDAPCITEVAMAVGFNDLTHFGRAFRKRYGVTPRDYRDAAKNGRPQPAVEGQSGALGA
jgi:AraC-like DNA-binding protein